MRESFPPQRIFPRYARLFDVSSRYPRLVPHVFRATAKFSVDQQATTSDKPPTNVAFNEPFYVIVAFPRSGSTFLEELFREGANTSGLVWKTHDPLIATSLQSPSPTQIIVPIRSPEQTVASWMQYNNDPATLVMARRRLWTYNTWYRLLLSQQKDSSVLAIDFETFTNPHRLHAAAGALGLTTNFDELQRAGSRAQETISSWTLSPNQIQVPTDKRRQEKDLYLDVLTHSDLKSILSEAYRLKNENCRVFCL